MWNIFHGPNSSDGKFLRQRIIPAGNSKRRISPTEKEEILYMNSSKFPPV